MSIGKKKPLKEKENTQVEESAKATGGK